MGEIASFKIGKLAKSLSNAMFYELMFLAEKVRTLKASANGIYDVTAVKVAEAPLLNSIKATQDVICKTVQYGDQVVENALEIIKKNPSILTQEGKTIVQVMQEVGKIEKNIKETGVLQKLLKDAEFIQRHDHQWETILSDGNKLILRRDIGKYAHPIKPGQPPVDHWNIQVQKLNPLNHRFEPYYNHHIVVDDKFNIVEAFGK